MSLQLPAAPAAYDRHDQASLRLLLQAEDRRTLKREGDLVLGAGLRLVAVSPGGARWALGVDDAGATVWTRL